ncbi:hypothetical protein GR170_18145 [Pseudooceanicola sp. GBMRC 2024]|uniref:Phosphodiester glycosidase domain-containing protein n=1 Tax=Pseudooceanicola albus TaxID=2692189 RepID=A0A6L7G899_9RHOB|nr:hypothetical protein [Pseudooceanicola albus]
MRAALLALGLTPLLAPLFPMPAMALECRNETWNGTRYALCEVDPAKDDLRLFLYDPGGAPYGEFDALNARLGVEGKTLGFAMNAGMYHEDRSPVGHYIENGKELKQVIPNAGPGNFGLLPNGVFCLTPGKARVVETLRYQAERDQLNCTYATQSGPMLVIDGKLHPAFNPDSTSRYIRNGVGVTESGDKAVFVISRQPVTFHEFASFFRDRLELPQALYFDGNISRLYAPQLGRNDWGQEMGPIVGVVVDKPDSDPETPSN